MAVLMGTVCYRVSLEGCETLLVSSCQEGGSGGLDRFRVRSVGRGGACAALMTPAVKDQVSSWWCGAPHPKGTAGWAAQSLVPPTGSFRAIVELDGQPLLFSLHRAQGLRPSLF